jgi:hypothetical protein
MEPVTNGTSRGKSLKGGRKARGPAIGDTPPSAPAAPGKTQMIFIPKIEVVQTVIEVVGISGLITHKWSEKAKQEMRDKQMGNARATKAFKVPEDDFNGARYIDAEGRDCVPALAFKNAAVEAGVQVNVFKTTLRKAFFVHGELLPLILNGPPRMREDMVRVGQGTADLRYRPEYVEWGCKIPVEFNPRLISPEILVNLFDNAGYSIGICEWRPEKDGGFGRFRVKLDGSPAADAWR